MELTPKEAFDTVNQYLPEAKATMRVAYITTGALLAFVFALVCHLFGCRRAGAVCTLLTGIGLGFWTPAGVAPFIGSILIVTSIISIWRETNFLKEAHRA